MSDIVIRNMTMPKSCFKSVFEHCEHYYSCEVFRKNCNERFIIEYSDKRHPDCPLKELPPHGDLVDRQEIVKNIHELPDCDFGVPNPHADAIWDILQDAPTVLEASET